MWRKDQRLADQPSKGTTGLYDLGRILIEVQIFVLIVAAIRFRVFRDALIYSTRLQQVLLLAVLFSFGTAGVTFLLIDRQQNKR